MMRTAKSLAQNVSIQKACKALDIPRASYYYYQKCKNDTVGKRGYSTPPLAQIISGLRCGKNRSSREYAL